MNDAVIQLNNLVKRFAGMDKPAVAPLNCTIQKGYVTGWSVRTVRGKPR